MFKDVSAFYFAWPWLLLLLLLIPVGWAFYLRRLRQRLQATALHFSYAAVAAGLGQQPKAWKRLLPPVSVSILTACLIVGLARPMIVAKVPVNTLDMMLVLDISLSMMADDIHPNRLSAAREAAVNFVDSLPADVRIGLEVFAGDNYVLSPPTRHHGEITAYLKALRKEDLKPRTEIGSALHTAQKILTQTSEPAAMDRLKDKPAQPAPAPSSRKPDQVIILLSDGDSHEGYPWDQAARDALQAHIIINTVGIGSPEGGSIVYQGIELPVNFDETTLRRIAEISNGAYFRVFNEQDFRKVYEQIRERTLHYEERTVDLAFIAAGLGLLTLLSSLLLLLLI